LKLLIVDDEKLIRQGIRIMLQGSGLSFNEVIEADSGRSAVSIARQHCPEIILMDIRMPGLDGISAAKQICDFNINCKIVFLTAYDHFEYAREAVRCRARDFLVKPVSREDLIKSLRVCYDEMNSYIVNRCKEDRIKQELFCSIEGFLVNCLVSGTGVSPQQLWSKLSIISTGPGDDIWFGPDRLPNVCLVFEPADQMLPGAVKKIRSVTTEDASCPVIMEQVNKRLICLAWVPENCGGGKKISIEVAFRLSGMLYGTGFQGGRVGIGKVYGDLRALRQSYVEALRALDHGAVGAVSNERSKVIHIDSIQDKVFSRPYQVVQKVIKYLEENCDKRISLEDAAQHVYLNPVYLSTIIKQETGSTFSDNLTLIRVEKAKKMLNSGLPIKEVAIAVGFQDCNYFCRVFKKVTGDTATGYRKKMTG